MYKILTVDDEVEICKIIQKFLSKNGFEVFTANNGEQALEIIGKEKLDLMILDKKMPGMGGRGLLLELEKRSISIPIIMLSGSLDINEHLDELKKRGYNDILVKPVDLNVLLETVKKKLKIES